jgi:glucokinase
MADTAWLVGDVGATNARFGLVGPDGELLHSSSFAITDFATIGAAVTAYLAQRGSLPMPTTPGASRPPRCAPSSASSGSR